MLQFQPVELFFYKILLVVIWLSLLIVDRLHRRCIIILIANIFFYLQTDHRSMSIFKNSYLIQISLSLIDLSLKTITFANRWPFSIAFALIVDWINQRKVRVLKVNHHFVSLLQSIWVYRLLRNVCAFLFLFNEI